MRPPKWRITSSEIPASDGVHGPGEITIRAGASDSMSAQLSASLRKTRTSSPNSDRYCTRL
jgi:hypothetical protein